MAAPVALGDPWRTVRQGEAVLGTVRAVRGFAAVESAMGQLRVGGVIDRDFRSDAQVEQLERTYGVHVLGCHEEENLFLKPAAVREVMRRSVRDPATYDDLLREVVDQHARLWIIEQLKKGLPESLRERVDFGALPQRPWPTSEAQ